DFLLAGGDGGVPGDEDGHYAAERFDAEGQRSGVEDEDVLDGAGGDGALDGGADGDDLVRIDGLVGLFALEQFLDEALHHGDAGGAADEDDLIDLARLELGIL